MKQRGLAILAIGSFIFARAALADWSTAKRLSWTPAGSRNPAVAIGTDDKIHVVWQDDTYASKEICYVRSSDGGLTWSSTKRLTWTSADSNSPAVAVDSTQAIHIVWWDSLASSSWLLYKKSADGGLTWSAAKRLTWNSTWAYNPALSVDSSDNLHVVWTDETQGIETIGYKNSTDGGTTWSAVKKLSWTSSEQSALVIDSSQTIHVAWKQGMPIMGDINYRRSTDGGATWSATRRLTWTASPTEYPAMASDSSGKIHLVWQDSTPGFLEIYYKRSTDGGTTWAATKRLTWTFDHSWHPGIAVDSAGQVHLVWHDYTPGNGEVFYRKSPDGGATWSAVQRLTWNSGESRSPGIAGDSGDTLHVVWFDDKPGNNEIYYKRSQ